MAFGAELQLVLGGGGQDGEREPAFFGVEVEVLGQGDDFHAAVAQVVDGGQDVGDAIADAWRENQGWEASAFIPLTRAFKTVDVRWNVQVDLPGDSGH